MTFEEVVKVGFAFCFAGIGTTAFAFAFAFLIEIYKSRQAQHESTVLATIAERDEFKEKLAAAEAKIKELEESNFRCGREVIEEKNLRREDEAEIILLESKLEAREQDLEKAVRLAGDLDMHTVHTAKCFNNRKSLSECLCGLADLRETLKQLKEGAK